MEGLNPSGMGQRRNQSQVLPGHPMPETLTWTLDQIMDGRGYEYPVTMVKGVIVTDLGQSTCVWAGSATGLFRRQSESTSRLLTSGSSTNGFVRCLTMITFPIGGSTSKWWAGQHMTSLCYPDLRMGQKSTPASRMTSLTSVVQSWMLALFACRRQLHQMSRRSEQ